MEAPRRIGVRLLTDRLVLRELDSTHPADGVFMLALLNDPGFLTGIADVGVRDLEGAAGYIARSCEAFFDRHAFGMYGVELRSSGELVGIMGLLQRDWLEDPDLGFAFLEGHCRQGYAKEAGRAAMEDARERLGIRRLLAITDRANLASQRCLEALGFHHGGEVRSTPDAPPVQLYATELDRP